MMVNKKPHSVINLHSEMKKALNENADNYTWLLSKCDRQENLAKLKHRKKGIEGMALNSFKKYCKDYIQGLGNFNGYEVVDHLRKELYRKYKSKPPEPSSEGSNLTPLEEAKQQIDNLRRNQAILVRAYNDLNRLTLDLIANSNGNQLEYNKHKKLYADYFSLKIKVDNEE